jgi:hypothetical protein
MTQLPSEIDGLSSAEFIGDSEIGCDGYGSTVDDKGGVKGAVIIAGATDGTSVAPSDGMGVGSKIGIAVAALALLLLLLLFVRRGKNDNGHYLTPYTARKNLDSVKSPHTVNAVSPFMAAAYSFDPTLGGTSLESAVSNDCSFGDALPKACFEEIFAGESASFGDSVSLGTLEGKSALDIICLAESSMENEK